MTAGHDSHFNQSTPIVTQTLMEKALHSADVSLDVRNVALGNNPCMPYDICVKFFTGYDADVVHWEQSYFCDGKPVMEQFIRQAMTIPTRPIVVFSESNTGHWGNDQCPKTDHTRQPEEDLLLKAKPMQLVSELNKEELHRSVSSLFYFLFLLHKLTFRILILFLSIQASDTSTNTIMVPRFKHLLITNIQIMLVKVLTLKIGC